MFDIILNDAATSTITNDLVKFFVAGDLHKVCDLSSGSRRRILTIDGGLNIETKIVDVTVHYRSEPIS